MALHMAIAPAMVAVRAKVPIYVVTMCRDSSGRYTLSLSPRMELTRSGNLRQDLVAITQRCQDYIESEIRKSPEVQLRWWIDEIQKNFRTERRTAPV